MDYVVKRALGFIPRFIHFVSMLSDFFARMVRMPTLIQMYVDIYVIQYNKPQEDVEAEIPF